MNTDKTLKQIEQVTKDINEIVMNKKDLTKENLDQLYKDNEDLKKLFFDALNIKLDEIADKLDTLEKSKRRNFLFMLIMSIVNLVFVITMPKIMLISTVITILSINKLKKIIKEIVEEEANLEAIVDEIEHKISKSNIIFENNTTFIFKKQKEFIQKEMDSLKQKDTGIEKMNIATNIINNFLENDIMPDYIDEEIKEIMIHMLQLDLNVSYNSLEKLLIYAKTITLNEKSSHDKSNILILTK